FPQIQRIVCRALAARELFRRHAPWAPVLPLRSADYEKMIHNKSSEIAVTGYFGRSWACANWGPHPSFSTYTSGLLACEYTPQHIRIDPELQCEFSPRELKGLDRSLCWGIHDRLLEIQQQLIRAEDVWRCAGISDDARWARNIIQQIGGMEL